MAIIVSELREWLSWLEDEHQVCIDDGGLSLQVVGDTEIYIEIGGNPEFEDDDDDDKED